MRLLLGLLLLLVSSLRATDLTKLVSARAVSVSNTVATPVLCPLGGATVVQAYIRPSSTAQIFTVVLPDGTSIEIPTGATFTLRVPTGLVRDEQLFTIQTGTGVAVLQVIGIKEVR